MKNFTAEAQDYFERHPSSNECHITSDGRVFHNKGGAQSMAGTLDDGEIESYSRKVLEKETLAADQTQNDEAATAELAEKTEFLKTAEVEKLDYKEVKALAKFFNLETEDQKAETLSAALSAYKLTLND